MDRLTPTAQKTYNAIRDGGPGNVHELCQRTGSSRSATDKALASLAKAGLIVKVPGGDPADGAPARWQHAEPVQGNDETAQPPTDGEPEPARPDADRADADQAAPPGDATDPTQTGETETREDDAGPADQPPTMAADSPTDADTATDSAAEPGADSQTTPGGAAEQAAEEDPPKLCRGCQTQIPKVCPDCWQKTPTYCGNCRRTMPQVRRGEPGEPIILSNGLPKLRPGELEQLVLTVMRDNPVPHHVGVTGWTGGRVAIFLPGRSTGAINNALEKLAKTGVAELIGDKPMRYQLSRAYAGNVDRDSTAHDPNQADAEPATADAAAPHAPETDATA